jgi:hypothetical protein
MIYIDFQGGAHGNYLEFVCNKFLAGVKTVHKTPFNKLGASHQKHYIGDKIFECNHYTTYGIQLSDSTVISINIEPDDLLPLQCVSLLRAGDYNIEPEKLETNTFFKLNNADYQPILDNLINSFFNEKYFVSGYKNIAGPSWPKIKCFEDFKKLPKYIQEECKNIHNIQFLQLNETYPDCPRDILKEFFKIGFLQPQNHGFIKKQTVNIHNNCNIYKFPFSCFYDQQKFINELVKLSVFLNISFDSTNQDLKDLHLDFLSRQHYKNAKSECDKLVSDSTTSLPNMNVIYEAYVEAMLEKKYIL